MFNAADSVLGAGDSVVSIGTALMELTHHYAGIIREAGSCGNPLLLPFVYVFLQLGAMSPYLHPFPRHQNNINLY
jgi:hypothetical protein